MWSLKRAYPALPYHLELLAQPHTQLIMGACMGLCLMHMLANIWRQAFDLILTPFSVHSVVILCLSFIFCTRLSRWIMRHAVRLKLRIIYHEALNAPFHEDETSVRFQLLHALARRASDQHTERRYQVALAAAELLLEKKLTELHY